jgi:glycosyltransferase involved in cell wall biosynthesis
MTGERLPVSVVIPAFNRAELLGEAITSVAAQTPHRPAEVIVVDDCSTDGTGAVAEALGARVIRHPHNRGAAAARNTGFDAATQPWVAPLDSDDVWLPHHLATLWRARQGHVLVAGAALACAQNGTPGADRYHGVPGRSARRLDSPRAIVWPENFLAASGVLVSTDAVRAVGGYDTSLRYAEDFDLWIRLLERGPGLALPTVVYRWRTHPGQKSKGSTRPRRVQRQIVRRAAGRPWWSAGLERRRLAVADWDDLRLALAQGRRLRALRGAARLLSRPGGAVVGLAGLFAWRLRLRRKSSAVTRTGSRSVALLPGSRSQAGAEVDLRRRSTPGALLRLARRPTGAAALSSGVVASRLQRLGVRALGIEARD